MRNLLVTVTVFLFWFGTDCAQQTATCGRGEVNSPQQTPTATQVQAEPLELAPVSDQLHPEKYAVAFLPLDKGNESVAFLVSPSRNGRHPPHA